MLVPGLLSPFACAWAAVPSTEHLGACIAQAAPFDPTTLLPPLCREAGACIQCPVCLQNPVGCSGRAAGPKEQVTLLHSLCPP